MKSEIICVMDRQNVIELYKDDLIKHAIENKSNRVFEKSFWHYDSMEAILLSDYFQTNKQIGLNMAIKYLRIHGIFPHKVVLDMGNRYHVIWAIENADLAQLSILNRLVATFE